jgi:hypothetical protein
MVTFMKKWRSPRGLAPKGMNKPRRAAFGITEPIECHRKGMARKANEGTDQDQTSQQAKVMAKGTRTRRHESKKAHGS